MDPIWLLSFNAGAQLLASSLLGSLMLLPMQPWAAGLRRRWNQKALLATHLDLYMLAFMQLGVAFIMGRHGATASTTTAWLLVFGGWMNPLPYLLRGFGINAFVFAGPGKQRAFAALGGLSVTAILIALASLMSSLWQARPA